MTGGALNLVLAFDSDSLEFTRGFELGQVWALLRYDAMEALPKLYHASNAAMLQRIAHARGYVVWLAKAAPGWIAAEFTKEPAKELPS